MESIERIHGLEPFENFKITNESYENLKIITPKSETILYLDPPYQGTGGYNQKTFDSEALYKWFAEQEYTCFISEYNAPFEAIFEVEKQAMMNSANLDKRKLAVEKLFWNGK